MNLPMQALDTIPKVEYYQMPKVQSERKKSRYIFTCLQVAIVVFCTFRQCNITHMILRFPSDGHRGADACTASGIIWLEPRPLEGGLRMSLNDHTNASFKERVSGYKSFRALAFQMSRNFEKTYTKTTAAACRHDPA